MQFRFKYIFIFALSVALAAFFVLALIVWLRPSFLTLHEERIIAEIIPPHAQVSADEWLRTADARFSPSVIPLLKKRKDGMYQRSQVVAAAVAITSDGYILTTVPNLAEFVALLPNGAIAEPASIVRDEAAGVTYAKLASDGWAALQLSAATALEPGERLGVIGPQTVETSAYAGTWTPAETAPSQALALRRRLRVASVFAPAGSPVVRTDGAIGLLADPAMHLVIPYTHFAPSLRRFLKTRAVIHPALAVETLDRNQAVATAEDRFSRTAEIMSVRAGSAAKTAGLRVRDLVLAVEGERLQADRPLAEILEQFDPLATVELRIRRGQQELTVTVPLTETPVPQR